MYFLDTNIFLEVLLEQEKSTLVSNFLKTSNPKDLNLSDLSLHSIGFFLFKRNQKDLFITFINDLEVSGTNILILPSYKYSKVKEASENFNLDFDDAYQYTCAKTYNLSLVTFDKDFKRTDINQFELN